MTSQNLEALRKQRGLSQDALAKRAGVSVYLIKQYEAGILAIRSPFREKLAGALGVSTLIENTAGAAKIALPSEFVDRCQHDGVKPEDVLNQFIADLCALDNSGGSDERDLAQSWYDRCGFAYIGRTAS